MSLYVRNFLRMILLLALVGGMLGVAPVQTVHAASLNVTNNNSSDAGSLSQIINDANSGDTITFTPTPTDTPTPTATESVLETPIGLTLQTPTPLPTDTPTLTPTNTPAAMFIQLTQPNGGELLTVGTTYRIRWNSSPDIDTVTLGYKACDGCLSWIATTIPNEGFYDWNVYVGNTINTQFRISITGYDTGVGSVTDLSDNSFTVLQPTPTSTNTLTNTPTVTPVTTYTLAPTLTPISTGNTVLVSVSSNGVQANNHSSFSSISEDGRFVAFESHASNLVPGDTNGESDIFLRDLQTGLTTRVSIRSDGTQPYDYAYSYDPSISADGRYVTFYSNSMNLVDGDTNGTIDIFMHDTQTHITKRVSVSSSGAQSNNNSDDPFISADGRYIAFYSYATNLVSDDTNSTSDIFVYDIQTGMVSRASFGSSGVQANNASFDPFVSADGRYVAFYSMATNLVADDTNGIQDIFVRDMQTNVTTRVSVDSNGVQANGLSYTPSISADGRYVAFRSRATNLVAEDTNGTDDVFIYDLQTGVTRRASVDSGGRQANGQSFDPMITANGRYIVFNSFATNLVADDTTSGNGDIFVHDLLTGLTTRASIDSNGVQANSGSYGPSISLYGNFITYSSYAWNLVLDDHNSAADVFVHRQEILSNPPTPTFTATETFTPSDTPTATYTATPAIFTLSLQPDAAAGVDSMIYNGGKTTNYGSVADLGIGEDSTTTNRVARSLLRFDLSSIPADATITSASLSLWTSSDLSSNTRTIRVYRLKVPFNESQVTWSQSVAGVAWQVGGASGMNDRESVDIGSLSIPDNEALNAQKQIILSPDRIQELVDGIFVNHGFIIVADTELNDRFNYMSSDSPTASQRPKLVIQYSVPAGIVTNTPSPVPTQTFTNTPSPTPTYTPTFTSTYTPTFTPTNTPSLTPTNTPTATATNIPSLFQPYVNHPVEDGRAVAIGDFNSDGLQDVALTALINGTGNLLVFLQDSNGNLTSPVLYDAGYTPYSMEAGDLNNDGRTDIVVTNFSSSEISIFLQQANGSLAPRVIHPTTARYVAVAVGDINGDELADIVLSGNDIGIFTQNPLGTLNPLVTYPAPGSPTSVVDIAIGDVNNDGKNDVIKQQGYPAFLIYLQNEDGSFGPGYYPGESCQPSCSIRGLGTGDVTGDGLTDVVMTYGGNRPGSNIAVFAQAQDGSLQSPIVYAAYDIPVSVEIADINQDNRADVLTAHSAWRKMGSFLQQANGALNSYTLYPVPYSGYTPYAIAVGDVNYDGLPDVVIADSNGLVILYHSPSSLPNPATPTRVPTNTSTNTPTTTPTFTSTPSPTASATPTFTSTATDTATSTPTSTLSPTNTPTLTATATESFIPTSTPVPTDTFTPSPSSTTSVVFPTTVIRDNFNRTNGSIGNNWYGYPSSFSIASNQLDVTATGSNTFIFWKNSSFGTDQEAYVMLTQIDTAAGNEHRLILKSQNSKNVTSGLISVIYDAAGQTVQVWTYHPTQGWVQHGTSIPVTFVNGDQFGARARPDGTVEVYRNGILLGTFNITSWPFYNSGGYIGMWFVNASNALLDNFGGGTR